MFLASIHQAFRLWSLMFRFISPVCSFWHCKYRCSRASLSTVLRVVYDIVWFAVQGKRCLPALNFGVSYSDFSSSSMLWSSLFLFSLFSNSFLRGLSPSFVRMQLFACSQNKLIRRYKMAGILFVRV